MAGDNLVVVDTASVIGKLISSCQPSLGSLVTLVNAYHIQKSGVCIFLDNEGECQAMGARCTYRLLALRVITTLLRITLWRAIAKDGATSANFFPWNRKVANSREMVSSRAQMNVLRIR